MEFMQKCKNVYMGQRRKQGGGETEIGARRLNNSIKLITTTITANGTHILREKI